MRLAEGKTPPSSHSISFILGCYLCLVYCCLVKAEQCCLKERSHKWKISGQPLWCLTQAWCIFFDPLLLSSWRRDPCSFWKPWKFNLFTFQEGITRYYSHPCHSVVSLQLSVHKEEWGILHLLFPVAERNGEEKTRKMAGKLMAWCHFWKKQK